MQGVIGWILLQDLWTGLVYPADGGKHMKLQQDPEPRTQEEDLVEIAEMFLWAGGALTLYGEIEGRVVGDTQTLISSLWGGR